LQQRFQRKIVLEEVSRAKNGIGDAEFVQSVLDGYFGGEVGNVAEVVSFVNLNVCDVLDA
jgi:hypothetical protein